MRGRLCGLICALMMMLSACSSMRDAHWNEAIQTRYTVSSAFSSAVAMRLNQGDTVADYRLDYAYQPGEGHSLTVQEPLTLSGLHIRVSTGTSAEKKMEVTYEGVVFTPKPLVGTTLSPVHVLCELISTWQTGFAESVVAEKTDGQVAVVFTAVSSQTGEELTHRTYFRTDTLEPVRAVCFQNGTAVLTVSFSDTQFTETEE